MPIAIIRDYALDAIYRECHGEPPEKNCVKGTIAKEIIASILFHTIAAANHGWTSQA